MSAAKKNNKAVQSNPRIVNRKARHDYEILDKLEVGVVLQGSEVKSCRAGTVQLGEGFARIQQGTNELFLYNTHIAEYSKAHGANGHDPIRPRKLLAHKREIRRLADQVASKGRSLIPLSLYFREGRVKLEIGVCQGKKQFDKRQDLKKKDADREIQRAMARKVR
ncbi:MAG: SsrA-binding protein SmpB [Phycisphaeraceae bacterium]|nr:SsrA-binding protein SmpB [Phycisphaeraceae bacterium]